MKIKNYPVAMLIPLLFLALFINNVASYETSKSFPITTLINAKWEQTPIYLEIAEYLADENPNLYWSFVKAITELDSPISEYGKLRHNVIYKSR